MPRPRWSARGGLLTIEPNHQSCGTVRQIIRLLKHCVRPSSPLLRVLGEGGARGVSTTFAEQYDRSRGAGSRPGNAQARPDAPPASRGGVRTWARQGGWLVFQPEIVIFAAGACGGTVVPVLARCPSPECHAGRVHPCARWGAVPAPVRNPRAPGQRDAAGGRQQGHPRVQVGQVSHDVRKHPGEYAGAHLAWWVEGQPEPLGDVEACTSASTEPMPAQPAGSAIPVGCRARTCGEQVLTMAARILPPASANSTTSGGRQSAVEAVLSLPSERRADKCRGNGGRGQRCLQRPPESRWSQDGLLSNNATGRRSRDLRPARQHRAICSAGSRRSRTGSVDDGLPDIAVMTAEGPVQVAHRAARVRAPMSASRRVGARLAYARGSCRPR